MKVIPAGEGPVGVAANDSAVWVSGGRTGTLSRIDRDGGSVEREVETGNRPQGLALAGDTLYAAVRASGLAHRGGKLTMLAPPFESIDPAALYDVGAFAATSVAYDGLIGFERVGGGSGARLVPDLATSIPTATDGGRTYTFQVRRGVHYSTGSPCSLPISGDRSSACWRTSPASTSSASSVPMRARNRSRRERRGAATSPGESSSMRPRTRSPSI